MRIAVAALLASLPLGTLGAQFTSALSVGSGVGGVGAGWSRESHLDPALQFSSTFTALRFDGSLRERAGSFLVDRATFGAAAATPAFGPFRLTGDATYGRDVRTGYDNAARVAPSLSARLGRTGAWFGSAYEKNRRPRIRAGVWTSLRSTLFSLSTSTQASTSSSVRVSSVPDSVYSDTIGGWKPIQRSITDTVTRSQAYRWSQIEARVDWSYRRLALTGTLAASRTHSPKGDSGSAVHGLRWGRVNAALMLNRRVSLIAAAGTLPRSAMATRSASRFATLGVRFAPTLLLREPPPAAITPSATSFAITKVEQSMYRVVLRVPSARSVQLSGDFNGWTAVAMTETSPNVWEVSLPLNAGTHRVNVRIDGDSWTAPPGLPSVNDEFNGRVGILVVR